MRRTLEIAGVCLLLVLWWLTWSAVYGATPLPQRIPTHFMANGQPNGWGAVSTLWLLPGVGTGVYLFVSLVALFPAAFNFPVRVTAVNRRRLETLTLVTICWVKVELASLFLYIQWMIIDSARKGTVTLSPVIVPVFLAAVFGTILFYMAMVFRAARER